MIGCVLVVFSNLFLSVVKLTNKKRDSYPSHVQCINFFISSSDKPVASIIFSSSNPNIMSF